MRTLPALLLASLILAGCSAPGDDEQEAAEDVQGNYRDGLGIALALTNDANSTASVRLRVEDADGGVIGQDNATVAPGETVVRQYAVADRLAIVAMMSYTVDSGGRASGSQDSQSFDLLECEALTRASWKLVSFEQGVVGSQWLGTRCEGAADA